MITEVAAAAIDGGDLPLSDGLLALIRPALSALEPDGVIAVLSRSACVREDLPSWCRSQGHEYLGVERVAEEIDRHLITRGKYSKTIRTGVDERPLKTGDGRLTANAVLEAAPLPPIADPLTGFAPRGASVEPG
ncbi:MAG TPA: sulfurtransferase TusA family protein, partial [Pyrinomonadaceae bacterium]|nr:sulfurtransferase TusA family protein [Pyrinomonadaceae bacterium]